MAEERDVARRWADAVTAFFRDGEGALDALMDLYDERVEFQDPLRKLSGRGALAEMNRRFIRSARRADITFGDVVEVDRVAFASWSMRIALRVGPTIHADGASHLRTADGRIIHHRDHFDVVGGAADAWPGAGRLYRALLTKIG